MTQPLDAPDERPFNDMAVAAFVLGVLTVAFLAGMIHAISGPGDEGDGWGLLALGTSMLGMMFASWGWAEARDEGARPGRWFAGLAFALSGTYFAGIAVGLLILAARWLLKLF